VSLKRKLPRLAVVCDYLEENWPSMDLVGEMLIGQLRASKSRNLEITRICPPLRRRFSALPLVGGRMSAFNADRLFNRLWEYPRELRRKREQFDLFHLVDHSYSQLVHALPPERTIVTCHDLDTFRSVLYPEQESRSRLFKAMTQWILDGLTKAACIICDSQPVRDQLLELKLVPAHRVKVISIGVHPSCSAEPNPAADAAAAQLLGPADDRSPLLLHVGSVIARKRIDVLLRVFSEVKRRHPKARLIRVGGLFTGEQQQLAEDLGLTSSVTIAPFLDRDVLAAVYRRAALVLQPSEREGFGLPVAEAMACGAPVVASDIAVLREVGGKAAVYCPVADAPAWADAASSLLLEREKEKSQWENRRKNCLTQAAQFSWVEHAAQVFNVYQEILA
jgi:glycosyltransferase involved in cell wall biosynthesis